ncbi:MAG: hypothetical protein J2P21_22750 [Chloracidobacterium sp.]|nr:hypothetical protein [Chloracidobacterium sp.]
MSTPTWTRWRRQAASTRRWTRQGSRRNAGIEAANLRAMQHALASVGGMIARDIQKNMEMRF